MCDQRCHFQSSQPPLYTTGDLPGLVRREAELCSVATVASRADNCGGVWRMDGDYPLIERVPSDQVQGTWEVGIWNQTISLSAQQPVPLTRSVGPVSCLSGSERMTSMSQSTRNIVTVSTSAVVRTSTESYQVEMFPPGTRGAVNPSVLMSVRLDIPAFRKMPRHAGRSSASHQGAGHAWQGFSY